MKQFIQQLSILSVALSLIFLSCQSQSSQKKVRAGKEPFTLAADVLWASPKGFDLTMDIYTPNKNRPHYPVIVMFHGGGWLINDKSIMQQSAEYLAANGEYVVCNVNYRLLGDLDNTVTINEIVEDAFGAVLWVKEHVKKYNGDSERIIVTGDSAGGHLAMMVAAHGDELSKSSFKEGPRGFNPTWKPRNKSLKEILVGKEMEVQSAIISYGVFDLYEAAKGGMENSENFFWSMANAQPRGVMGAAYNYTDHEDRYKKVSPIYNVPNIQEKKLPPILFTVGSEDKTTTPASIEAYIGKLKEAGHKNIEYWVHEDRPHAFLDSGSNEFLKINFEDDAIPALDKMISYLDSIFYKE